MKLHLAQESDIALVNHANQMKNPHGLKLELTSQYLMDGGSWKHKEMPTMEMDLSRMNSMNGYSLLSVNLLQRLKEVAAQ